MSDTFKCPKCKQSRHLRGPDKKNCLACSLHGALLQVNFNAIITHKGMKDLREHVAEWYCI